MQPVFDEVIDSATMTSLKMTYQNIRQFERAHHIPAIAPAIKQKLNELWKPKE